MSMVPQTSDAGGQPAKRRYTGEVVYIFAFDIAYEMSRAPLRELLGQPVAQFSVDVSKRTPKQLFFYRAQMVRLPPLERFFAGPNGGTDGGGRGEVIRLERTIKLLPVGAISITVRVGFAVDRLADLVAYHDLQFSDGSYLHQEVVQLAEDVRRELAPHLIRPVEKLAEDEAYTVFCLPSPPMRTTMEGSGSAEVAGESGVGGIQALATALPDSHGSSAEAWLLRHRREVAALLTEETDSAILSEQEALDSTSKYLSYYAQDLVVLDWDAALVLDSPNNFEETLYLMELANLQLAELEAYDAILDEAIENAYRDLAHHNALLGYNGPMQQSLKEIRIDMARLSDELSNITKFFGDWHLARIYKTLSERFHLNDWHKAVDEKLKTLDDLYQLLQADRNNRMMMLLEVTIVLLFVIDLIIIFVKP